MLDEKKLDKLLLNYQELQKQMMNVSGDRKRYAEIAIEFSNIEPLAKTIIDYREVLRENTELNEMLKLEAEDKDIISMVKNEILKVENKIILLEEKIKDLLLPKDIDDKKSVIIEIRAGTGGDEAAILLEILLGCI